MPHQLTLPFNAGQWAEVVKTFQDEDEATDYIAEVLRDRVHQARISQKQDAAGATEARKLATEGF
jgi:hypothetical protein